MTGLFFYVKIMTVMAKDIQNFSRAENQVRAEILAALKKVLGKNFSAKLIEIGYPPESKLGDFSVPCFLLAEKLKKSAVEIANFLADKIKPSGLVKRVEATGPYLNFFVNQPEFSRLVLIEIAKAKENYGAAKIGKGKRVMVEYFSPNTNKPLTIGHIRNICLGWSLSRLLKFLGYKVIESTLYNDRGIAIAKTIVGYLKWGKGQTPKSAKAKPDHFVGSFYVKFCQEAKNDPNLELEAKKVLQDWEKGKKEVKAVWQKLTKWVLEGFDQTLDELGSNNFAEKYYESEYYDKGKEIVWQGLKKRVFVKDKEGVVTAPLAKYGLPDKIVLRPDETSLYITQDLYLAFLKDKYNLDQSIYVVASEQDLYFQQLFKILELLGFKSFKGYYHLSYGMVRLASGRIKSREGLVKGTGADELMAEMQDLASQEIKVRFKNLKPKEVANRARKIALGALKFFILTINPKNTIVFDPEKSLSFMGRTGPYLQYVFARINSIFAKGKARPGLKIDFSVLNTELEFNLIKLLARFPQAIEAAVRNHDPSCLANYLYDLAKVFSLFYEELPVLASDSKVKAARLLLINDIKIVLAQGLSLLGIEAPEKM